MFTLEINLNKLNEKNAKNTSKNIKLIKYLNIYEGFPYSKLKNILRKKDIKINGKRVSEDIELKNRDKIEIYATGKFIFNYEIIFEDDNILVVNKPKKLEVISEDKDFSLLSILSTDLAQELYAVHRLDFNTEGLVVFAKNLAAKSELEYAFKSSLITKKYLTITFGEPIKEMTYKDFLIKNADSSKVKVVTKASQNAKEIITGVKPLKARSGLNLLEVTLHTGRTHQIRAHLSFHNQKILGDEKYGDFDKNKDYKIFTQALVCNYLKFNFEKDEKNKIKSLKYLNNNDFLLKNTNVEKLFNEIS